MILDGGFTGEDSGYVIERSLRFSAASSQYLTRTPSVAGDRQKFTYSVWVKRGILSSDYRCLLSAGTSDTNRTTILFDSTFVGADKLVLIYSNGANNYGCYTSMVFRDPFSWYHIVISVDTTQATAASRVLVYVNGIEQTTNANPTNGFVPINSLLQINSVTNHGLGGKAYSAGDFLDGYITKVDFIDGQALTPSSFGETNTLTGQWVAKKYTGTYGTNGFHLDFKDGTSTTTLGYDKSGNGNNWTLTNFTRSAGVNDCWMLDVPAGNASASAVQPSGNYAVLNPLVVVGSTGGSTSGGNLVNTGVANPTRAFPATIASSSGKFYAEFIPTSISYCQFGVKDATLFPYVSGGVNGSGAITWDVSGSGSYYVNGSSSTSPVTVANNDVVMVAFDAATRQVWFGKNGVWNGSGNPAAGTNQVGTLNGTDAITFFCRAESTTAHANFGQRSFAYTPPAGFKALCTANLPAPSIKKPSEHFNIQLSTGANIKTDSEALFTNELEWIKDRANANNHQLIDSVRGSNAVLQSNTTAAETTYTAPSGSSVGWVWRASDSAAVTNNNGSISSQVSANIAAGFSVVTYTGNGSTDASVGHGLGVVPKLIIVKRRNAVGSWVVVTSVIDGTWDYMNLDQNVAKGNASQPLPSSTVFNVQNAAGDNVSGGTYVAYCFAEVAGYSKIGSYTGNGNANGPFVYCGFLPKFLLIKRSDSAENWAITDLTRSVYNPTDEFIFTNTSQAEGPNDPSHLKDVVSNGFKLRNSTVSTNASGGTHIYMAFAETPFQYANAR